MYVRSRKVGKHRVWYAICYWYNPETGKRDRDRKSTGIRDDGTAASRKRAELQAAERERRLASGLDRGRRTTIAQAFTERESALIVAGAPRSTLERAEYSAAHLFKLLGPDTECAALSKRQLVVYAQRRMTTTDSKRGASADTVRRELADLSAACAEVGVTIELPDLPEPRVEERWLTPDECVRLLAVMPWKRARVVIVVLQTGLRKAEPFHLEIVGPGVGRLRETEESRTDGGLKTGERTIPLTPLAESVLAEGPLEPWVNQGRDLKRYARKAGLGLVTWNVLRASTATQLLIADVPPTKISALLGHKSDRMIMRRYARLKNIAVTPADLASLPVYAVPAVGQGLGELSKVSDSFAPPDGPKNPGVPASEPPQTA